MKHERKQQSAFLHKEEWRLREPSLGYVAKKDFSEEIAFNLRPEK
jgi:hypothetical protein